MSRTEIAPAFQVYAADALADTAGLTLEQAGAYWRLAMHAWREQGLPDDRARLARVLGLPPAKFAKLWPALADLLDTTADGRLVFAWMERQREELIAFRERQSENGKKGGRPRKVSYAANDGANDNPQKPTAFSGITHSKAKKSSVSASVSVPAREDQEQEPKGAADASRRAGRKPKPDKEPGEPAPWMGSVRTVWRARYQADPPPQAVAHLRPVFSAVPEAEATARLDRYLGGLSDPRFFDLAKFASTHGAYASEAAPKSASPPNVAAADEAEILFARLERAGLLERGGSRERYLSAVHAAANGEGPEAFEALVRGIKAWELGQIDRRFVVGDLRKRLTAWRELERQTAAGSAA